MRRLIPILALVVAFATPAAAQANLQADVAAERAKYGPQPTDDELCAILNAVAWKHRADGWGLSAKPWPTNCRRADGVFVAHDILHHKPTDQLFDVFVGAGAQAEPTWNPVAHHNHPERPWVAPIAPPTSEPDPDPDPDPEPQPGDLGELLLRLVALLEQIRGEQAATRAAMDAQTAALKAAIADLQKQVAAGVPVRIRF